ALAESGQIDKAENYYGELQRAFPLKGEISTAVKNLSARRTMNEGGYEALAGGTGSYRDILRDKQGSQKLEQEGRVVRPDDRTNELLTEYEARAVQEPNNFKLLRNIAELHTQKKDFDKALEYYQR